MLQSQQRKHNTKTVQIHKIGILNKQKNKLIIIIIIIIGVVVLVVVS